MTKQLQQAIRARNFSGTTFGPGPAAIVHGRAISGPAMGILIADRRAEINPAQKRCVRIYTVVRTKRQQANWSRVIFSPGRFPNTVTATDSVLKNSLASSVRSSAVTASILWISSSRS